MTTARAETVPTPDGRTFTAHCAVPDQPGPGILLFQEIFGVNDNMRGLADRLAREGYVVLVPDVFWRIEPGFERNDESALQECMAMVGQLDWETVPADISAAHAQLLSLPECTGTVGAVGFCLGGTLAFLAAARSRVDGRGIDAAVSYYGSGNNGLLPLLDEVRCPVLFHYGDRDPYIPTESIDEVERAIAGRPGMRLERYDAGHAFSNWDAPSMYDQSAAEAAWTTTTAFLAEHLR
ncbi:MAG: dienelactone hydrolase family protein [Frankiales bacterium]|nr:MAG: dienelactone hydrolase family protein [Frankiales bacterium]